MTEQALRKMIAAGESTWQEFKSWVKCKDYRQRKELAVKVHFRRQRAVIRRERKWKALHRQLRIARIQQHDQNSCRAAFSRSLNKNTLNNLKWGVQFTTVRSIFYNRNQI